MRKIIRSDWQIPAHEVHELSEKEQEYCLVIPIINESLKFHKQLLRMEEIHVFKAIDVIIADGGSTDDSIDLKELKKLRVKSVLIKRDTGKLSAQLRMAYAYALDKGYKGIVTIDGNNKDSVGSVDSFIVALQKGYDYVQGSRFIKGGRAVRTPRARWFAIRGVHAPLISLFARKWLTDTTNGFRGYSRKYLLDQRVQPFRDIFQTYELLAYLSIRASQLGLTVKEIPVSRTYPATGKTPTKITGWQAYWNLIAILFRAGAGVFNPS